MFKVKHIEGAILKCIDQKQDTFNLNDNKTSVLIEGYATTYNNIDSYNDVVVNGACINALENLDKVKLLWQHDMKKPIGIIKSMDESEHGLLIKAEINTEIEQGKEAVSLIKQGAINGLSIGFTINDEEYDYENNARIIKNLNLWEVSVVTIPANNKALITRIYNQNIENNMNLNSKKFNDNYEVKNINNSNVNNHSILENETKNKLSNIEYKLQNIQNVVSNMPEQFQINNIEQKQYGSNMMNELSMEYKSEMSDFLKKGKNPNLLHKDFSSGSEDQGSVLTRATFSNRIISKLKTKSVLRNLASIDTISSGSLDVILEDGDFDSGWVSETDTRNVTSNSKLLKKTIDVHEIYAQPRATQRLLQDTDIDIESWIIERIVNQFARAENEAFISGDGNNKPFGLLHEVDGVEKIDAKLDITIDDILKLILSLDDSYISGASFLMHRSTLGKLQCLKDAQGRFIWQHSITDPMKQTLFGIPVISISTMPILADNTSPIILADFKEAYKIVEQSGVQLVRDQYTEKPYTKFYATKRVGGSIVNPSAIKLLHCKTQ